MKVCHILDELAIGGLEQTVIDIVLNLPEHTHEVWCLKRKGALAGEIEKRGVRVREFGFSGAMTPRSMAILVRLLREGRFDIVHSHGAHPVMWGEMAACVAGVRVRIDHAQNLFSHFSLCQKIKLNVLSRFATRIIAVSDAVKKSLVDLVRIDPRKIDIIYNSAPDLAAPKTPSRAEARASLGIADSDFLVGSVGRLERHKGHAYLLDAVALIPPDGGRCACVIVGDGPAAADLKDRIRRLKLDRRIVMTGWRRDAPGLMRAMDLYVQPSTLFEGLPLALAEAASSSLPLIATDIGGNAEIVSDGVNGFVVPPRDALALADRIATVKADRARAERMGAHSRRIWQERFSQALMIRNIADLYNRYSGG